MINDKLHKLRIYQDEIEDAKLARQSTNDDSQNSRANTFISRVSVGLWSYFSGTPKQQPEKNNKAKIENKQQNED